MKTSKKLEVFLVSKKRDLDFTFFKLIDSKVRVTSTSKSEIFANKVNVDIKSVVY